MTEAAAGAAGAVYRELARNAFVTLYWRGQLMDETAERLRVAGFVVVELDASGWTTADAFHDDVAAALDFPDYYGRNLDAFNDCLRDTGFGEHGMAFAFRHYDVFARACPREAHVVLDTVADHARQAAVEGLRLLGLVQSDDPDLRLAPVGAQAVGWNPKEWLDSSRHPKQEGTGA